MNRWSTLKRDRRRNHTLSSLRTFYRARRNNGSAESHCLPHQSTVLMTPFSTKPVFNILLSLFSLLSTAVTPAFVFCWWCPASPLTRFVRCPHPHVTVVSELDHSSLPMSRRRFSASADDWSGFSTLTQTTSGMETTRGHYTFVLGEWACPPNIFILTLNSKFCLRTGVMIVYCLGEVDIIGYSIWVHMPPKHFPFHFINRVLMVTLRWGWWMIWILHIESEKWSGEDTC